MNHVYRLKRSGRTQQLQPVPESACSAGKGSASAGKTQAQTVGGMLASFALSSMASLAYAQQAPPTVHQLPQGGVVSRGSANIVTGTTPAGNAVMTVNQGSNRAVIDWASFNLGSQARVQFNQPSTSAVVLNNILGNNASQIYGQISANGQVFLSNPNGVYFSPTSQVNVGGLVATTGKANGDEFMAGKVTFNRSGSTGSVVNEGQLTSAAGRYIALLAPDVRNQGVVVAQAGTVALASGESITLSFNNSGTGLAGITTTPQTIAALVENRSAVLAEGGYIVLSAHALAALQGSVVKNSGQLSATSLTEKGGKIVLMADTIELTGTSRIQANGPMGGGTVLVGGDWQGSGDTRQAVLVTMAQGASIEANATQQGDGGKVVLWSDVHNANGLTDVHGTLKAEGGTQGGNGGRIETSGHHLDVGGAQVSTEALRGSTGEWLLDPYDITINATGPTSNITSTSTTYTANANSSVIQISSLITALASNNITIATGSGGGQNGDITIADPLSWTGLKTLTLTAAGSIILNANVSWSNSVNTMTWTATNGGLSGSGNITMPSSGNGSGFSITQGGTSTYAGVISGAGDFTKAGNGILILTGNNNYTGDTNSATAVTTVDVGGSLQVGNGGTSGALGSGWIKNSGTLIFNRSDSSIISQPMQYTVVSPAVTSTGLVKIMAGTWQLNADNLLSPKSVVEIAGAATLDIQSYSNSVGGLTGSGTVTSSVATGTLTFTNGSNTRNEFSGQITGPMRVVMNGASSGTQALSGANTYSGTAPPFYPSTTINAGTLEVDNASAVGTGGIQINSFATAAPATLAINGVSLANTISQLNGNGTNIIKSISTTNVSTLTGTISASGKPFTFSTVPDSKLVLSGTLSVSTMQHQFTPAIGGEVQITGPITSSAGSSLTLNGPGKLTLAGNDSAANFTLSYAAGNTGTIRLANNNALGAGNSNFTVPAGATLELGALNGSNLNITGKTLTLAASTTTRGGGYLHNVAGQNTWSGAITLNDNSVLTIDTGTSLNLSSPSSVTAANSRTYFNLADGNLTFNTLTGTPGLSSYLKSGAGTLSGTLSNMGETVGIYAQLYDATGQYSSIYGDVPSYGLMFYTAASGGTQVNLSGADYSGTAIFSGMPGSTSNAGSYSVAYSSGITISNNSYLLVGAGANRTWTIVPKVLSLSALKTYDGTLTLPSVSLNGLVGNQTLSISGATANSSHVSANGSNFVSALVLADGTNGGVASNYSLPVLSHATAPVTIIAQTLTVSGVTATDKMYDGSVNASVSGGVLAGVLAMDSGQVSVSSTGAFASPNAANGIGVNVALSGTANSDYVLTQPTGLTANISPKPVTVSNTARSTTYDGTSSYGTLASGTQFTTSALVGQDTVGSVTQTANGVTPTGVAQAGSFTVTPSAAVMGTGTASNYSFSYVDSTHTVDKANLALNATASLTGNVYNGTAYTGTYTTTALGNDASGMSVTGVATGTNAGTYTSSLAVTGAALANYNTPVYTNASLVISPKAVTVTNTSRSTTYDGTSSYGTLASGTQFTTSALVGQDTVGSVTQTANGVTPTGVAQAGSFTVTPSAAVMGTGTASNYSFSYVDSTHTVNPATVTVMPINGALQGTVSKVYDGTNTATLTSSNYLLTGWAPNEGASVTRTVGTYDTPQAGSGKTVTVNLGSGDYVPSGLTSLSNYTLPTTISGAVGVITVKPVTVTNTSRSTTYDGTSSYGTLANGTQFTTSALVGQDAVGSVTQTANGVTSTGVAQAGSFTVTPSAAVLGTGSASNYSFSYVDSTHTVNPATVTVMPINGALQGTVSKVYDGTNTATLTSSNYLLTGWAPNEGATVTRTTGTYDTPTAGSGKTVTVNLEPGDYVPSGTTSLSNYNLPKSITGAVGIINKAALTATGNSARVTYNGANQSVSGFTVTGLQGTDTLVSLTSITATDANAKNAGSYINTVTAGVETNYIVTTVNGILDIAKANATVTANSGTLTYNGASQTVSGFTASGLVGGETASVLKGLNASRTEKNAGTYVTTASGTDANYNLTFVDGSMVINKAALTVHANNDAKFVTQADAIGYAGVSYSGWVGDESPAVLGGAAVVTRSTSGPDGNTGASNATVGSYTAALTVSGLSSDNYTIRYAPGNYTVVPADQLLVKLAPITSSYGTAVSYSVAEARYLNRSNVILDLTGNVSRNGNSFTVSDGVGGSASFTVSPTDAVTSGSGQLAVGSYSLAASGVNVVSNNFSKNLTLVGTQSVMAVPVTAVPQVSKVYDGSTAIANQAVPLTGALNGDVVAVSGAGAFANKNVGSNLGYSLSGLLLSGADAGNYYLAGANSVSGNNGTITRLAQVSWAGGATGNWFDPAKWAGGAVPDLANVATVTIPAGVTVSFGTAVLAPAQTGVVSLDALGTAGSVAMSGGTLNVGLGGVTLGTLTQTGGSFSASGAVLVGSLSQTAGSLTAGRLSTTTAFSQSGAGSITVTGPAQITATQGPVVLGQLSVGGDLNVNSTDGVITQTAGTALSVAGTSVLSASANGQPADVRLTNAGNVLAGSVTVTGHNVSLNVTGPLTATVTAAGDATLSSTGNLNASSTAHHLTITSGGNTTLGLSKVGGDLNVNSVGKVSQIEAISVAGTSTVTSTQSDVLLDNSGNSFAEPVVAKGLHIVLVGTNATPDMREAREAMPPVLTPALADTKAPYAVTVVKAPQEGGGVLHLELRNVLIDQQIMLPAVVRDWVAQANGDVRLLGPSGETPEGMALSANGSVLSVNAVAYGRLPEHVVLQTLTGQMVVRLVKAP